MKKMFLPLLLILGLVLIGCNVSIQKDNDPDKKEKSVKLHAGPKEEKKELKLQVLKMDADKGITLENSSFYKEMAKILKQHPDAGTANDFSIFSIGNVNEGQQNAAFVFLGINRTNKPLKNIQFNLTLKGKDGTTIWEDTPVNLTEEQVGDIQPNAAVPVLLKLNSDQEERIKKLNKNNTVIDMKDFKYEVAK
ncbi:hypothetical protein ACFO4N_16615 [Camelliibacillus cellulosilyticus]|uniref:Lipoprotein n=1 Tax=Camelliibacillus cellulosilyticus TaxID=2174486 RepID=A0ABV9GQN1_9BACL